MLALSASARVYVASAPVDMRRGHDGLFAIIQSWGLDPFSGDLFGFIGKRRARVKILSGISCREPSAPACGATRCCPTA